METENHNEEAFRKLLKSVSPESPDTEFTQQVLKKLDINMQYSSASEELAFKKLFKTISTEQPSRFFTNELLMKLQPAPAAIEFKPVISRRMWIWIAASIVLALMVCLLLPANQSEQTSRVVGVIDKAARSTYIVSDKMDKLPELYSLAIIGLASLLLFDYFLRLKTGRLAKS